MSLDKKVDFEDAVSLLAMNHLSYESPSSAVACSARNQSQINFQPRSYNNIEGGGVQMSLVFNTGSALTLGPTSMINIKLRVAGDVSAGNAKFFAWGNNTSIANGLEQWYNSGGSILNMFSEVSCNARSGELLFRETFANVSKTTSRLYKINKERRDYLGIMGGASVNIEGQRRFPLYALNQDHSFSIPLSEISSMFSCASPLPAQLLSGATLRFTLAKPSQAMVLYSDLTTVVVPGNAPALGNITVNIVEATAYLDSVELFDSVNSLILASANSIDTNGLQYGYHTMFSSSYEVGGTGNIDIQLSAARIKNVLIKFMPRTAPEWTTANAIYAPMAGASIAQVAAAAVDKDANGLQGMKFRWRLGNQIMPYYDVQTATQSYALLKDALCNIAFDSCEDPDSLKTVNKLSPCSIQFSDYVHNDNGATPAAVIAGGGTGCFMLGLNFERSSALNVSGQSTNNARVLTFEYSGIRANTFNAVVTVEYMQIANISTSNVVVNK